eukprot:scaffold649_cov347-Pavlova_lutheri.AAC.124
MNAFGRSTCNANGQIKRFDCREGKNARLLRLSNACMRRSEKARRSQCPICRRSSHPVEKGRFAC